MADEHISPGFLTPSAAEHLKRVARQTEDARQQLANRVPPSDEKDFPAVITSGSGGYHAWTEQAFDATGARYTKPGGRTGTAASNPACLPDRSTIGVFPYEVWLRRTIWNATYGVIYEVISHIGSEVTLTSFSFDHDWTGPGSEIPVTTNTTLHTLTLDPGVYVVTIDVPLLISYGFGGGTSHVVVTMSWALGTAIGTVPPNEHSYETLIDANSTGNVSICNPYYSDTIIVTTAGTVTLNVLWSYQGSAVPTLYLGQGYGGGTGYYHTISTGTNPYAIGSIAIGSTPVTGSNAGAILYSNGTTLQQVAVMPVGGIVYMGGGAPAITEFSVGALVSQLWQNMR